MRTTKSNHRAITEDGSSVCVTCGSEAPGPVHTPQGETHPDYVSYADLSPQAQFARDQRDRLNACCQPDCDSDPEQDAADGTNAMYCEWQVEGTHEVTCYSHGGYPPPFCGVCRHYEHHDRECSQPAAIAAAKRRRAAGFTIGEDH